MRFYLNKIGGHLQELAVLAMVFVPLDLHLNLHAVIALWGGGIVVLLQELRWNGGHANVGTRRLRISDWRSDGCWSSWGDCGHH